MCVCELRRATCMFTHVLSMHAYFTCAFFELQETRSVVERGRMPDSSRPRFILPHTSTDLDQDLEPLYSLFLLLFHPIVCIHVHLPRTRVYPALT